MDFMVASRLVDMMNSEISSTGQSSRGCPRWLCTDKAPFHSMAKVLAGLSSSSSPRVSGVALNSRSIVMMSDIKLVSFSLAMCCRAMIKKKKREEKDSTKVRVSRQPYNIHSSIIS